MHHWIYVPCMPWACSQELCESCHNKTKDKIGWNFRIKGRKHSNEWKTAMSIKMSQIRHERKNHWLLSARQ